ncbi:MAG: serine/threonine-protein kinase [Pseudomonadales bacterium]|jgi:serine/threonine-protein kinase|nr:serine/threonine-protein kinase [Pseudomonadales bacterium]
MTLPHDLNEAEVLRLLERALDVPAGERHEWLRAQALPPPLLLRLVRLLEAANQADDEGFLDTAAQLPDPDNFPRIGERVGPFRLTERIDAGGMGVVYRAQRDDLSFQQQVALKLIRPLHLITADIAFRKHLIERFENERQLLARLDHPNIARILDGGATAAGEPWLAMEYVKGQTLIEYCDTHTLDVRERLRLFLQVCAGVQEAHRHLIVHRDLKPDNILVTAEGQPKLLDFGIARALEADARESGPTMITAMTPVYASPEHIRRQSLTTASDVYSLGVVLYQLLTGERPYRLDGLSPAEAEHVVCDTTPAPLREHLRRASEPQRRERIAQITADLEQVVAKAMHKEPQRRYDTAQALSDDINRWLAGHPVLAFPDSASYRAQKFVRRHRLAVSAASIALLAVFTASAMALWQSRQARQAADDMRQMNAFLLDVLKTSDPYDAERELTLSEALDAAAGNIDTYFKQRPDLSAELRFELGNSMLNRERLEQAEQQLTQALAEHRAAFGDDDSRTLRVRQIIALLHEEQGRFSEAKTELLDVIAQLRRLHLTDDPVYGSVVADMGSSYLATEDLPEADEWLQHAKTWQDAHPKSSAHNRAVVLGNPTQALELAQQALAMRRKIYKNEHPQILFALRRVAEMLLYAEQPAQALPLAEEAAAISDQIYATAANSRHVDVWATLAEARLANDDVAGAVTALTRTEALLAQISEPAPRTVAMARPYRASRSPVGRLS